MKILNELLELAKRANVAGQGTPEMVEFRVVANPDTIIAIAEAFRELEQRAEAAEAKAKNLNDGWLNAIAERDEARTEQGKLAAARSVRDNWKERAWAAEEKLAELEKQKPVFQVEVSGSHWINAGPLDDSDFTGLPDGINLLFARPANHTGSIT